MKRTVFVIISLLMLTCMLYGLTTPVLIDSSSCWRGIVQPGRNCISNGDTISAIFSKITTDPNDFQRFIQSYSVDGGATWSSAQVGLTNCERTYPHQDQIDDVNNPGRPYSSDPQLIWLEKHYPGGTGEVYYAHDDLVPYQLFTPVEIKNVKGYFPTLCVWGTTADTIFATSCDVGTDDIYGWRSEDHGATWIDDGAIIPNAGAGGQVAPMVDNGTNGYSFMLFGRQGAAGQRVPAQYCETVDYGATWTAYDTVGNLPAYSGDILSIKWRGYSAIVDGYTNTPYMACDMESSDDPSTALNIGELYFTKPSSGTPGSYVFGDWVGISIGDPDSLDVHCGDPTIGYYYSATGIVLYIIYTEAIPTGIGTSFSWEIMAATSIDDGVTWNIDTVTTPGDTTDNKVMTSAARYITGNNMIHVVYHNPTDYLPTGHSNDNEKYDLMHIAIDAVNDLGLPPVGVEEGNDLPQISMYNVSTFTRDNLCTFRITLPEGGHTTLDVYDALGRRVATVYNGYLNTGINNVEWNVEGIASGSYIYRMTANGFSQSDKVLVY